MVNFWKKVFLDYLNKDYLNNKLKDIKILFL